MSKVGPWLWRFAQVLGVLCLPLFLITVNLRLVTNSPWLYEYGFSAYHVPAVTGIPLDQLLSAAKQTRDYFTSEQEPLSVEVVKDSQPFHLYNPREVQHMADVKALFRLVQRVEDFSGSYLLGLLGVGLWVRKKAFVPVALMVALRGGLLTIGVVFLAGLSALLDFDRLFLQFHLLSFTNTLWLLDPSRDHLIMMYPAGFFRDATLAIAGLTLVEAPACLALAAAFLRRMQERHLV